MPIWPGDDTLHLVADSATVCWLDLSSPFGDAPAGVDWSLRLPEGLELLDLTRRPRFGCGPDAHRPLLERSGDEVFLSFRGPLPGDNQRRPMSQPRTWSDLHFPLVLRAQRRFDGAEVLVTRRALGDHDERRLRLSVLERPALLPPPSTRRCLQLLYWPWFSTAEQEALGDTLRACGFTDLALNWHGMGLPTLPIDAYGQGMRALRRAAPGTRLWIGGLPGVDTPLPRAEDRYGHPIPFVCSPAAALGEGADLVVASERSWCELTGADGVMLSLAEPSAVDTDLMPAHDFSQANRALFAAETGLDGSPDAVAILHRHRESWVDFCCRQVRRLLEVARHGHGERPLAVCAYGPGGPARAEASADWRQLAEVADLLVYAHRDKASDDGCEHWGYTRLGGLPQTWWHDWHDPLGSIPDRDLAIADARMQLALSGGHGLRLGSWAQLDGRLQQRLMAWR